MLRYSSSFRIALFVALASSTFACAASAADQVAEEQQTDRDEASEITAESGWIKRNSTPEKIDASFTLVDRWGTVHYYLTEADNVDLEGFVNRHVSVRGQADWLSNQRARLLSVEQIDATPAKSEVVQVKKRPAANRPDTAVRQAAHQMSEPFADEPSAQSPEGPSGNRALEPTPMPEPVESGSAEMGLTDEDGNFLDCYDGYEPCDTCGPCGKFCGPPGMVWARMEYLYWWTQGMHLPPLVSTGPSVDNPGYLGSPGTQVLFGDTSVNGNGRSGGRFTAGAWLNSCRTMGIQGDYFALGTAVTDYSATSGGNPILSRPFFDTAVRTGDTTVVGPNIEKVAFPDQIAGTVSVHVPTRFQSGGIGLLFNLCCNSSCNDCSCCPSFNGPSYWRLDFLLGYRFAQLTDGVTVNENLTSLEANNPGSFVVNDSFSSQNRFNGVELGTILQKWRGRWSIELVDKIALGNNNEYATVNGYTTISQPGAGSTTYTGGLLAQTTNIGNYRRNEFAVIPQLGLNLGYQITPRVRVLLGYTFFYWSRVARAGDLIDTDVNSSLLPPPGTLAPSGDLRHPQFVFKDTDFWAQGISTGIEVRW